MYQNTLNLFKEIENSTRSRSIDVIQYEERKDRQTYFDV